MKQIVQIYADGGFLYALCDDGSLWFRQIYWTPPKEMYDVAREIINKRGLEEDGYSLVINGGSKQDVKQVHLHLGWG